MEAYDQIAFSLRFSRRSGLPNFWHASPVTRCGHPWLAFLLTRRAHANAVISGMVSLLASAFAWPSDCGDIAIPISFPAPTPSGNTHGPGRINTPGPCAASKACIPPRVFLHMRRWDDPMPFWGRRVSPPMAPDISDRTLQPDNFAPAPPPHCLAIQLGGGSRGIVRAVLAPLRKIFGLFCIF